MSQSFSIRKAINLDISEMVRLRRLMFEWMNYSDKDLLDNTDKKNEDYFRKAMANESFYGWVAINNQEKIVGCGGLVIDQHPPGPTNPSGKIGYIMNMSVEVAYRNLGIAKEILKEILIFLKDQNITVSSLHATEMGKKLYEKFGFSFTNEMRSNLSILDKEKILSI